MFELIPAGTHIDFIGRRRICAMISLGLILASVAAVAVRGVRWGIDFQGGTEVQIRMAPGVDASEGPIRDVVTGCGVQEPSVVRYGGSSEFLIKFKSLDQAQLDATLGNDNCPLDASERSQLTSLAEQGASADLTGQVVERLEMALTRAVGPLEVDRVEFVGPRVGEELREDGVKSLSIACALILVYVAFRFSTRFAPGAIVALIHDISITAGIFVLLGLEFDLRVLAALLAIMGYSLNDTIIIYDRIRENMELRTKHDLEDVLNRSVNQTLSRTILTSGTTMAAVLALLFLGGEVIRPFAIAMSIGIIVGTYSSVFIAAPTLLLLEQRANRRDAAHQAAQGQHPKAKATGSSKPKAGGSSKPKGGGSSKPKGGSARAKRGSGKGKRAKARA